MAALLALTSAAAYGAGGFLGGVASRRAPVAAVALWSYVVGLVVMLAAAPLIGGEATPRALAVGGAAGLVSAVGVAFFYRALAVGAMGVVAPVVGLLSAAVPVVAGIGGGERPNAAALAGIVMALLAVALLSRESTPATERSPRAPSRGVGLALMAGLGFGLFFLTLDSAGPGTGIWPLVAARLVSVTVFAALGAARLAEVSPSRAATLSAAGAGLLDAGAAALYVVALSHGLLSIVAVLTALYPAGTVVLARCVLRERMSRTQQAGLAFAGVAASLIAL
jgi:drug/metabolite transporter (DMT)-like permease